MPTYTVHQAKTNLSKLLAEAEAGEEVIIARDDKPVARLTSIAAPSPKREFGAFKGQFAIPDVAWQTLDEAELRLWYDGPVFPELSAKRDSVPKRSRTRRSQ